MGRLRPPERRKGDDHSDRRDSVSQPRAPHRVALPGGNDRRAHRRGDRRALVPPRGRGGGPAALHADRPRLSTLPPRRGAARRGPARPRDGRDVHLGPRPRVSRDRRRGRVAPGLRRASSERRLRDPDALRLLRVRVRRGGDGVRRARTPRARVAGGARRAHARRGRAGRLLLVAPPAPQREALAHLLYGIGEGGSFVLLTGEVGTGKTTVCRALLEQVPPDVDVAMIFNPRLTSVELLAAVCDEFRVSYPAGTTSLKVLVDALSQALLEAHGRRHRTVLIIDEAQNLAPEVLEEIRLLTNLETTREKLLQVILIGQPELPELLPPPQLPQLAQRVTAPYHLRPLTAEETRAYLQHRMEGAGQQRSIFAARALRAAHRIPRGVPRLLNTICDRALLGAYATGQTRVTAAIVRRAGGEG